MRKFKYFIVSIFMVVVFQLKEKSQHYERFGQRSPASISNGIELPSNLSCMDRQWWLLNKNPIFKNIQKAMLDEHFSVATEILTKSREYFFTASIDDINLLVRRLTGSQLSQDGINALKEIRKVGEAPEFFKLKYFSLHQQKTLLEFGILGDKALRNYKYAGVAQKVYPGIYPKQASYGEMRAISELRSIVESQWENGMMPQIRFSKIEEGTYSPNASEWGVTREISGNQTMDTSGITQPPVMGMVLGKMIRENKNTNHLLPIARELLEPFEKFHDFLLTERVKNNSGLASIINPWAAGTDNAPIYDGMIDSAYESLKRDGYVSRIPVRKDKDNVSTDHRPHKKFYDTIGMLLDFYVKKGYDQKEIMKSSPFLVEDVLFNSILASSLEESKLLSLKLVKKYRSEKNYKLANYYQRKHKKFAKQFEDLKQAINKNLYDSESGLYYSRDATTGELVKIPTVHSLFPLFVKAADARKSNKIIEHILDPKMFNLKSGIGIPTTALSSEHLDPLRYWKGPIWPVTNWFVAKGLNNYKRKALANKLIDQTLSMLTGKDVSKMKPKEIARLKKYAEALLIFNSTADNYMTKPNNSQYPHGWLWDSGFAALGWKLIKRDKSYWKKELADFAKISKRKVELKKQGYDLEKVRKILGEEFPHVPMFDEYFTPVSLPDRGLVAGDPLGIEMITWSGAIFLDLLRMRGL